MTQVLHESGGVNASVAAPLSSVTEKRWAASCPPHIGDGAAHWLTNTLAPGGKPITLTVSDRPDRTPADGVTHTAGGGPPSGETVANVEFGLSHRTRPLDDGSQMAEA